MTQKDLGRSSPPRPTLEDFNRQENSCLIPFTILFAAGVLVGYLAGWL